MAVFSKIISLAVLLAAAAVTTEASLERPLARTVAVRRHPARAHNVTPLEKGAVVKRASGRKKRCAAKTSSTAQAETTSKTTTKTTTKAASTTTSKAASNTGSSSAPSGGKAGLGWNNGKDADISQFTGDGSRVSWCYSWSPWPCNNDAIDFVTMLWGAKQVSDFNSQFNKVKPKYIIGFNEPDLSGQANLSPGDAVSLWYEQIDWRDAYKISPAPSGGQSGRDWLTSFMAGCSGCNIDAVGVHYYSTDADALISYVKSVYKEFGKPIWVTEWACQTFPSTQCSVSEAKAFNKKVMAFFESTDYIHRYAAFGALLDMYNVGEGARLMSSSGKITDLGVQYAYGSVY